MKKLLAAILLTAAASVASAQTTGTTNVHVKLTDVLSLTVNDQDVNINFDNETDYQNGVSVPMSGHLTVTSNQSYNLNVKAAGNLTGTNLNSDILEPSVLTVEMPAGGNNTNLGETPSIASGLSSDDSPLLSGAAPAVQKLLDITYSVPASVSKTNAILGKTADTYSTVVTYTVTSN
jgi:hypothetical protein